MTSRRSPQLSPKPSLSERTTSLLMNRSLSFFFDSLPNSLPNILSLSLFILSSRLSLFLVLSKGRLHYQDSRFQPYQRFRLFCQNSARYLIAVVPFHRF